jgi:hypothetical protein
MAAETDEEAKVTLNGHVSLISFFVFLAAENAEQERR